MPDLTSPSQLLQSLQDHPDVVTWINDVLDPDDARTDAPRTQLTELDQRVSGLVGGLEIASEETSAHVERIVDEIARGAGRLAYDLHFMRDGALALQATLGAVQTSARASLEAETNAALERLHFLDTVRRNMDAARAVLREAESWGTLESDVTGLLGERNYEKAAERLSEASKSMVVFANTPEYESRRTLMVSLQNQLEAALSSALVAAVSSQDVAVCRSYFAIFTNIQREAEFRNYYYGSRRGPLVESWQGARLRDCDGGTATDPAALMFSTFLPNFYASFLSILQTERTSIPAIFPDPQPTLSSLITSTLHALQPSFSERLAALTAYYGPTALTQLINAFKATEELAVATDKVFEKLGYSAITDADGPQPSRAHLRRRSSARMSMSMSRRTGPPKTPSSSAAPVDAVPAAVVLLLEWDQELFAPFADYQADYAALERRLLDDALAAALRATAGRASSDRVRVLRERSVDVFGAAEDALARYVAFTHGYGAEGVVQAVDRLIAKFADATRAEVAAERGPAGGAAAAPSTASDLSDMDYTAQDWADIQALLHMLEAVRALLERTAGYEGKLRASLVQVASVFRAMRAEPGGMPVSGTTRGAMQLLAQSSLNSARLHALLDSVDPEPQASRDTLAVPTPPSPDPRRASLSFVPPSPAPPPPLLTTARTSISGLAQACQIALQNTILSPLRKHLATYASSPLWSAPGDARPVRAAGGAIGAVQVPTFSRSSSETIQRVAEGLLTLPRLFEVYADDDALAFSLGTLPHVSAAFLRELAEPVREPQSAGLQAHSRRNQSLAMKSPPVLGLQQQPPDHFSPEAVTAVWLASLGRTLLAHLTGEVLPRIRTLTPDGATQLAADLAYLGNIVEALNVEWPVLNRWRMFAEMEDADGRDRVKNSGKPGAGDKEEDKEEAGEEDEGPSENEVLAIVARLRGWAT